MVQHSGTLHGVLSALYTPLDEAGRVVPDMLGKQVEYLTESGVDGLFLLGTTAEGAFLRPEDKRFIYRTVTERIVSNTRLCVALLQPTTDGVLREMDSYGEDVPDYFVAVTPYYGGVDQDVIIRHYTEIADRSPVPVLLYDIPSRTANRIATETLKELRKHPNIAGIKDSSGDFVGFSRFLLGPRTDGFRWIQGHDALDAAALLHGADGIVSGLSNIRVTPFREVVRAAREGSIDEAISWQRVINMMFEIVDACNDDPNRAIKAAVTSSGRGTPYAAIRSQSATGEDVSVAGEVLRRVDAEIQKLSGDQN